MRDTEAGPKRRKILQGRNIVAQVEDGNLSKTVLINKLSDHVEAVDADMVRPPLWPCVAASSAVSSCGLHS